jgi:SAM-dependent methyltransferase
LIVPGGLGTIGLVSVEFDFDDVFDDDYLYFYEPILSDERSDADAELIWQLGPVQTGTRLLDLACGHGRLANRLALRGASVTGYDITRRFLEVARADAARQALEVDYVQGDIRDLDYVEMFDVVVSWFTSFGYFGDDADRQVLRAVHRSIRAGGSFLVELLHGPGLWARFLPCIVNRRGDDMMIDENRYDATTGRVQSRRTIVRGDRVRTFRFSTRVFSYPEIREWLETAGFSQVEGFGTDGSSLSHESHRMIVRAVV